jgi:hypothetical protein
LCAGDLVIWGVVSSFAQFDWLPYDTEVGKAKPAQRVVAEI